MSRTKLRRLFLFVILGLSISCHAMDFSKPWKSATVILLSLPLAVDCITATDEWTYRITNTQTVLGALGIITLSCNFFSAYLFYRKNQSDYEKVLKAHIAELERGHNMEDTEKATPSAAEQALAFIEREKNPQSTGGAIIIELE